MGRSKSCSGDNSVCHICGLPIPDDIRPDPNTKHDPLCGTADHVQPTSKGGPNTKANRRAAHYLCNTIKGDKSLEEVDVPPLRKRIVKQLRKGGHPIPDDIPQEFPSPKPSKLIWKRTYDPLDFIKSLPPSVLVTPSTLYYTEQFWRDQKRADREIQPRPCGGAKS